MDESDQKQRISYQGIKGSFSWQASHNIFPEGALRGYGSFHDAIQAVHRDEADFAVIPVENSTAGRVMEVYNLLPESGLHITGEYMLPIHHCLMVPFRAYRGAPPYEMSTEDILEWKDSPLSETERAAAFSAIREVQSHPQALSQCRKYLKEKTPRALINPVYDTAASAREIANDLEGTVAAIASKEAGQIFNMIVLEENIEDIKNNTTRFLVLGREALPLPVEGSALTSILFETAHRPGSLFRALEVFERHGINLTKLETYMSGPDRPNPTFYVDVGASVGTDKMDKALEEFKGFTKSLSVMGSYPASPTRGEGSSFLDVE